MYNEFGRFTLTLNSCCKLYECNTKSG